MNIYQYDGSNSLPTIFLDKHNQTFEIIGSSFPEDSNVFYEPVFKWLKNFEINPEARLSVTFKFDYFNTSSSKVIQNIIDILSKLHSSGTEITAKWFYSEDDEEIYEAGIDFTEKLNFKMRLVPYKP